LRRHNEEDNKKVYILTDAGRRFLDEHRDTVKLLSSRAAQHDGARFPGSAGASRKLPRTIFSNYSYLDDEKIQQIEHILDVAKKQIAK